MGRYSTRACSWAFSAHRSVSSISRFFFGLSRYCQTPQALIASRITFIAAIGIASPVRPITTQVIATAQNSTNP